MTTRRQPVPTQSTCQSVGPMAGKRHLGRDGRRWLIGQAIFQSIGKSGRRGRAAIARQRIDGRMQGWVAYSQHPRRVAPPLAALRRLARAPQPTSQIEPRDGWRYFKPCKANGGGFGRPPATRLPWSSRGGAGVLSML